MDFFVNFSKKNKFIFEVRVPYTLKSDGALFFQNNVIFSKKCPKWPKMDCFDNFSKWPKSESHIFSDILHEVKGT